MQTISTTQNTGEHPLDKAARILHGRGVLAEKLGVSAAAVGNWKIRGVPIEKCNPIERLTEGQVCRPDLRPDDWADIWPELAEAQTNTVCAAIEPVSGVVHA